MSDLFTRLQSQGIFKNNELIFQENEASSSTFNNDAAVYDNYFSSPPSEEPDSYSEIHDQNSSKKQKVKFAFNNDLTPKHKHKHKSFIPFLRTLILYLTGILMIILCAMKMKLNVSLSTDLIILISSLSFFIPYLTERVSSNGLIHLPFALFIFAYCNDRTNDEVKNEKIKKIYQSMIVLLLVSMLVLLMLFEKKKEGK